MFFIELNKSCNTSRTHNLLPVLVIGIMICLLCCSANAALTGFRPQVTINPNIPVITTTAPVPQTVTCQAPCECLLPSDAQKRWGADGFTQCSGLPCEYMSGLSDVAVNKYCYRQKPVTTTKIAVPDVTFQHNIPLATTTPLVFSNVPDSPKKLAVTTTPTTPITINQSAGRVLPVTTTFCLECLARGANRSRVSAEKQPAYVHAAPETFRQASKGNFLTPIYEFASSLFGWNKAALMNSSENRPAMYNANIRLPSVRLDYMNKKDQFIEMESNSYWNTENTNGWGIYTWDPNDQFGVRNTSSAVWQVSLLPFPNDYKDWYYPPGFLGMGTMGPDEHEFTVNFSEYLPRPAEVDAHWEDRTSMLRLSDNEIKQLKNHLEDMAIQAPFDPDIAQYSGSNRILTARLMAAQQDINAKLNNPALQGYLPIYQTSSGGVHLRQYASRNASRSQALNPEVIMAKTNVMKEAEVLTLPTEQRTVYLRVVTLDSAGNCTGLSNDLPVTVGKKQLTLVGPWSGWKEIGRMSGGAGVLPYLGGAANEYVDTPATAYFNGKTYLFAHRKASKTLVMGTVDPQGTFSGWSEVANAPQTSVPVSAATVALREGLSPAYLYIFSKGQDSNNNNYVFFNRMDSQGNWGGWTTLPLSIKTAKPISASGWVHKYDHGLIFVYADLETAKFYFATVRLLNDAPNLWSDSQEWSERQEVPGLLCEGCSEPPRAVFFSYEDPETPVTSPDFMGTVFITRAFGIFPSDSKFKINHLYVNMYTNARSMAPTADEGWKCMNATSPCHEGTWSGWSEIPGGRTTSVQPSVRVSGDRVYVAITDAGSSTDTVTYLDGLNGWAEWISLPDESPATTSPVLGDGPGIRVFQLKETAQGQLLITNAQPGPQLYLDNMRRENPQTAWMFCTDQMYCDDNNPTIANPCGECVKYYNPGDVFVYALNSQTQSHIPTWGAVTTTRQDGTRIVWQISRQPFSDMVSGDEKQTFNTLGRATGVIATGWREVLPAASIPDKPADIPPVHQFSMNLDDFAPMDNARAVFYVRAILMTPSGVPGQVTGYVTPQKRIIAGPVAQRVRCPPPTEKVVDVPVPDVAITQYRKAYAIEPGCHFIATRNVPAWAGVFGCPDTNSVNYMNTCPEDPEDRSWWDDVCDFFESIVEFFESVVNAVSRAWDGIKGFCIDFVASCIPFCDDTYCKAAISGCVDAGLASMGIPPSIPNFAELEELGGDYLVATLAEVAGVPPEATDKINQIRQGVQDMNAQVKTANAGDACGWVLNPDYEYHAPLLTVVLTNRQQVTTPPGELYFRDIIGTHPKLGTIGNYITNQRSVPYPSLAPGQSLTIPVILGYTSDTSEYKEYWSSVGEGWNRGFATPHPFMVREDLSRSIQIAGLENDLGMVYTDKDNYYPLFGEGACNIQSFYVRYNIIGKSSDNVMINPSAASWP